MTYKNAIKYYEDNKDSIRKDLKSKLARKVKEYYRQVIIYPSNTNEFKFIASLQMYLNAKERFNEKYKRTQCSKDARNKKRIKPF